MLGSTREEESRGGNRVMFLMERGEGKTKLMRRGRKCLFWVFWFVFFVCFLLWAGEMKWAKIKAGEFWVLDIRKKTYGYRSVWWKCGIGVLSNEQGTYLLGGALRLHVPAVGKEHTRWPPEASSHQGICLVSVDVSKVAHSENRKSLSN